MPDTINPEERTAAAPARPHAGPVTLVNCFVVDPARDDAFVALWTDTSGYFRARPGFVSLRLHRALSPETHYRYINVATWESAERFLAAHDTDEFRAVVGQPAWSEFPSSPALYEVVTEFASAPPG